MLAVTQINNTPLEGLSLADVKKLLDRSRDKLQIIVSKPSPEERLHLQPPSMPSRVDEGEDHTQVNDLWKTVPPYAILQTER